MKDERPPRILIVRTDRLGDVVLTLPMARAIKQALPNAHVSFLARSYTQPVLERAPDVDTIFMAEDGSSFWDLVRVLRSSDSDMAFFPNARFPLALAAFFARIPKRAGTGFRWYSVLFTHRIFEHRKTAEHHEAVYNLRMLEALGITADEQEAARIVLKSRERSAVQHWLASNMGEVRAKFAVFHVTNGGSTMRWPTRNFVELGRTIAEKYGMTIILTGQRQDSTKLERAAEEIGAQRTLLFLDHSLPELGALLERAAVVIATGTGPGHLAAALGAPTIGLFPLPTPISKERWGFRGRHTRNLSPEAITGCPNCEHCTCMERLDVERVRKEVEILLDM